jgi:hypothetical protein
MWQSLLPFFQWSDNLWIGHAIGGTRWAFPLIETIHILALAMNVRGDDRHGPAPAGHREEKAVSVLARSLEPYMDWGLIIMLVSGFLLFTSEALKSYANDGFRIKMVILVPAVLFQYTLFRRIIHQDDAKRSTPVGWAVSFAFDGALDGCWDWWAGNRVRLTIFQEGNMCLLPDERGNGARRFFHSL